MTDDRSSSTRDAIRGTRQRLTGLRDVQRVQSDRFSLRQFAQGKGPDHVIVDITHRPVVKKPE
jgi:hypothetical protein